MSEVADEQLEKTLKGVEEGGKEKKTETGGKINEAGKGEIIERRVEEMALAELKDKLKGKNQYSLGALKSHGKDVMDMTSKLEEGEEATEELVRGAFQGSEKDLAKGFFGMLTLTLNMLKPIENFDAVVSAMNSMMDESVEKNLKADLYKDYYETEEGRKRLQEIRSQFESEYENK
jgi:hypothetical protein